MAKAGLTIAISGTYNGRALEKARQDLAKMKIAAISEMGGAGQSLVEFGARAAEVGGEIHNMGYKMEQVGSTATRGITLPIVAAAAAVGAAAVNMDTSLTNVKKTVDGTDQQYQALKDSAIEFSKTNAVSASQIMDMQSLGAQLGFTIDELDEFGRVVSGLDIATNMDAETAGTEMAQFANITKMAHSDISNYGSAIVGLGNNMATTESDISSMAMRLAAAGTQVGMSQADILGLAAALSSMGVEAEAGGTAISTIMSQIDKDIATNSDAVETWAAAAGMSARGFADAWKNDPVQALTALLSNMEKTTAEGGNMSVMLEELGIDSVRQTDIMKRLAGNSDLVTKAVSLSNEEWEKNTALQNEVDNRNESMAARLQILQNKVVAVAEKVGTPLVNALLDVVDAAEPLVEGIGNAAQAFSDMEEEDQKMVLGLVGAAAAFGPVMTVAGKLTQGIGSLIVGVGRGAQTLALLKNELGTVREAFSLVRGGAGTAAEGMGLVGSSTTLVSCALGVLKTAMVGLGIGAAIALIGSVVTAIQGVIEHEQKVVDATYGLETAMGAAAEAYGSYADGAGTVADSLGNIKEHADEVIESQGKLAQSMADTWADYGTNAAMVDAYAQEIQELTQRYDENGNKVKLTADEQTRLKLAVDGFNEVTGSSISVTDAFNGVLDTSTETIRANAEAFKEQARAEAAIEMYKDVYKQQLQDAMALEEAQRALTEADEGWGIWLGDFPVIADEASVKHQELESSVNDLQESYDSAGRTMEQLLGVIDGSTATYANLDEALDSTGVKMEDFGQLTEGQLSALRDSFDGKLSSIVTTCNEQGIEIPQSLADAISANKSAVNEASEGLGNDVSAGIAQGIQDTGDQPKSGIEAVGNGIINWFKNLFGIHSPSTVMAELGRNIDLGLKAGIEESQGEPTNAVTSLGGLVQNAISGLPGWMQSLGTSAGGLLSTGLSSLSGAVQSAGSALFNAGKTGTNPITSALGGIGRQAGNLLAGGLNALTGSARNAGTNLNNSAQGGTNPVVSALGSIGSSAANCFSNAIGRASAWGSGHNLAGTAKDGMGSVDTYGTGCGLAGAFSNAVAWTSAWGSGQSLASSARDGLGSVETYGTGRNFSGGFLNGMNGVSVWNAAYNIGRSALGAIKSALGIASPSKEAAKVGEWFGEGAVLGMKSTEADIAAESRRMSQAMSLDPEPIVGYGSGGYAASSQTKAGQGRQFVFNVTINASASGEQQAAGIGRSIADELYLQFARRERAYA